MNNGQWTMENGKWTMRTEDKLRITKLLGLGIRDVRQLHIGDMGWMNGWGKEWMNGGLEWFLYGLCKEQKVPFESVGRWPCLAESWAYAPYNVGFGVDSSG